jgi:ribosome biogenesis GTPase / thiamine phosphate phosphatase
MDLKTLGFDDWFGAHASATLQEGQRVARIMTVDRGSFLVRNERSETIAELSGKFRFSVESGSDFPCVGDWVCMEHSSPTLAIIHSVLPRKTFLSRKHAGKIMGFQMIATNLDVAFIVQSCHYDFNLRRLDRFLVAANEGQIEPIVILSKTDLVSPEELDEMIGKIRGAGISARIFPISNTTGSGLDEFRDLLVPGKTFCLLGSSGVGKTTIINRLIGRDVFDTKAVSVTGEGVHTTSRRQLHLLDSGAMLVDTPGMRELGLLGASDGVEDSFSDIHDLSLSCRFPNCTHTQEPSCAVLIAIEAGGLGEERYQSYLKLKKETEFHDLSYARKRKKDREFGRFIKSAKKHGKR